MNQHFYSLLTRYADLIVSHGMNVQPGQIVSISCEIPHRELALLIMERAYSRGAQYVAVDFNDPAFVAARVKCAAPESLSFVPSFVTAKADVLVDTRAASLRITGPEDPDALEKVNSDSIRDIRVATHKALKRFYDVGLNNSQVHWCVAAAATKGWANKVFPKLSDSDALNELWDHIFNISRVTTPDYINIWKDHDQILKARAEKLNSMRIKTVHFTGPGTDLRVGLSPAAIFKGASEKGPYGVDFEPNIPTEEVFTTPDWRTVEGTVRATRPFFINGKIVRDLSLKFEKGEITDFSCSEGKDTFFAAISSDPGAKRLGELALVGTDSPIYKTGLVFQETLLDENAACHIAIGFAYRMCIKEGNKMSDQEFASIGGNNSSVHSDIMISSEEVSVSAILTSDDRIPLIDRGTWVIQ